MPELTNLLDTEIWPWLRTTVTIGVVMSVGYWLLTFLFRKWRELPLIEIAVINQVERDGGVSALSVNATVYNRGPAAIRPILEIVSEGGVMFDGKLRGDAPNRAVWGDGIEPCPPSATRFQSVRLRGVISSWPEGVTLARVEVRINSSDRWMRLRKVGTSIKKRSTT